MQHIALYRLIIQAAALLFFCSPSFSSKPSLSTSSVSGALSLDDASVFIAFGSCDAEFRPVSAVAVFKKMVSQKTGDPGRRRAGQRPMSPFALRHARDAKPVEEGEGGGVSEDEKEEFVPFSLSSLVFDSLVVEEVEFLAVDDSEVVVASGVTRPSTSSANACKSFRCRVVKELQILLVSIDLQLRVYIGLTGAALPQTKRRGHRSPWRTSWVHHDLSAPSPPLAGCQRAPEHPPLHPVLGPVLGHQGRLCALVFEWCGKDSFLDAGTLSRLPRSPAPVSLHFYPNL